MFTASIQKIKHGVPKGDKKRQKQAKEEIAKLEAELAARHEQELKVEHLDIIPLMFDETLCVIL